MEHAQNFQLSLDAPPDRIDPPAIAIPPAIVIEEIFGFDGGERDRGRFDFQLALVGRADGLAGQAAGQARHLAGQFVVDRRQVAGILGEQGEAFFSMQQETFWVDGAGGAAPGADRAAGANGQLHILDRFVIAERLELGFADKSHQLVITAVVARVCDVVEAVGGQA